ncbi:hypothetical protein HMPREF0201_01272 [Cedecea davisae DSM 4568]|uniref:Uncharacterized protein n=1 Tax=Cedecea davisae DSM 4568 TaxID=566551 RepID=S3JEM9_9ENTR|nr:hypothetical protein HMPREF0201_01272 [Cedecea davisae DSM 4568]
MQVKCNGECHTTERNEASKGEEKEGVGEAAGKISGSPERA